MGAVHKSSGRHGPGHVKYVMCRAHRKTAALLRPVTNPPMPPRMAPTATMNAPTFCKRVSTRRRRISICRPSQKSSCCSLMPRRPRSSREIGVTSLGQPAGLSVAITPGPFLLRQVADRCYRACRVSGPAPRHVFRRFAASFSGFYSFQALANGCLGRKVQDVRCSKRSALADKCFASFRSSRRILAATRVRLGSASY